MPSKKAADFKAGDIPDPAPAAQRLIKIEPGAGPVVRPNVNRDPYGFYLSFYRSRDEGRINPDKLRQNLAFKLARF